MSNKTKIGIISIAGKIGSGKDHISRMIQFQCEAAGIGFYNAKFALSLKAESILTDPIVHVQDHSAESGSLAFNAMKSVANLFGWTLSKRPPSSVRLSEAMTSLSEESDVDLAFKAMKDMYPEFRRYMQRRGTEAGRNLNGLDCWIPTILSECVKVAAKSTDDRMVICFTDTRFSNEAEVLNSLRSYNILIQGPPQQNDPTSAGEHVSEQIGSWFSKYRAVNNNYMQTSGPTLTACLLSESIVAVEQSLNTFATVDDLMEAFKRYHTRAMQDLVSRDLIDLCETIKKVRNDTAKDREKRSH